jgi:hypothetical protein
MMHPAILRLIVVVAAKQKRLWRKIKMKSTSIILLSSTLLLSSSSALSASLVELSFDANLTPHTTPMQIKNIDQIDSIFTYGPYAIATGRTPDNHTRVAFFNGKTWSNAQPIPDTVNIDGIYPSYPQTAKQATAWALVDMKDPKRMAFAEGVDYFDGQHWLKEPQNVDLLLGISDYQRPLDMMAASSGTAYLVVNDHDSRNNYYTAYLIANTNAPTSWKMEKKLPGKTNTFQFEVDSFNDKAGNLYLTPVDSDPSNNHLQLYKVTPTGVQTTYNISNTGDAGNSPAVLADSGRVFVNDNKLTYNKNDGEGQWSTASPMRQIGHFSLTENQGLICNDTLDLSKKPNSLSLRCLDATQSNALWKPTLHLTDHSISSQLVVRNNGAWLYYLDNATGISATILDYTAKTNRLYNTNFPTKAVDNGSRVLMVNIAPTNLVVACGLNANTHQPEYRYYQHGNTHLGWQSINTNNMGLTKYCGYSTGGNTSHPLNSVNTNTGETLWLFNDQTTQ